MTIHANRKTLMAKDMKIARRIRGDDFGFEADDKL